MPEPNWSRHGLAIGRQEFRRTVRSLRGDSTRLVLMGFVALFFGSVTLLGTWLVLRFADGLGPVSLTDGVRGSIALQWLFAVFIFAQRAGSRHDRIDNETLVLTTVSVRSATTGIVAAEVARALAYIGVPIVLLGGAFVYATVSPLMVPFLALAVVLSLSTAAVLGYALGLAANLLVARVRFVARHKSALGVAAVIVFFGAYFGAGNLVADGAMALLGLAPFAWFVDLALVGSPVVVSVPRAAVAAVGGVAWLAGCGLVVERLATAYWFGDSVRNEVAEKQARVDADGASDPLAAAVRPLRFPAVARPTRRVAQRAVVVARRNPSRLSFLLFPLIFAGSYLYGAAEAGGLPESLAVAVPLLVPWLAGGAFGLNPFGDEGAVLPATLVSLPSGRQYAAGLALPGLLLGLPLTVVFTAVAGVVAPFPPTEVGLLVAAGAVLTVAAVVLAPAVGMTFPRYDPIQVRSDREVVPPSLSAIALYTLALGLTGGVAITAAVAPATLRGTLSLVVGFLLSLPFGLLADAGLGPAGGVATWLSGVGAEVGSLPLATVHWGGYALGLLAAVLLASWSVRAVIRRFEGYTYG